MFGEKVGTCNFYTISCINVLSMRKKRMEVKKFRYSRTLQIWEDI